MDILSDNKYGIIYPENKEDYYKVYFNEWHNDFPDNISKKKIFNYMDRVRFLCKWLQQRKVRFKTYMIEFNTLGIHFFTIAIIDHHKYIIEEGDYAGRGVHQINSLTDVAEELMTDILHKRDLYKIWEYKIYNLPNNLSIDEYKDIIKQNKPVLIARDIYA